MIFDRKTQEISGSIEKLEILKKISAESGATRTIGEMPDENGESQPKSTLSEADFMRLFARHEMALRNYARLILPDWTAVDDAIQDASVTMWENRAKLRDESGFLPWGKVIVRNRCFNAIAKMRRDRLVLDESVLERIANEADVESDGGSLNTWHEALDGCLRELSPERRDLVLAPYRGAGAVKELAEAGRRSPNSLYKLIGRLREKLSACVENKLRLEPL